MNYKDLNEHGKNQVRQMVLDYFLNFDFVPGSGDKVEISEANQNILTGSVYMFGEHDGQWSLMTRTDNDNFVCNPHAKRAYLKLRMLARKVEIFVHPDVLAEWSKQ